MRECIEREIKKIRKSWLRNVHKAVEAPPGYRVNILPLELVESSIPTATPVRIVDGLAVPPCCKMDPDRTHPHRQNELVQLVNKKTK